MVPAHCVLCCSPVINHLLWRGPSRFKTHRGPYGPLFLKALKKLWRTWLLLKAERFMLGRHTTFNIMSGKLFQPVPGAAGRCRGWSGGWRVGRPLLLALNALPLWPPTPELAELPGEAHHWLITAPRRDWWLFLWSYVYKVIIVHVLYHVCLDLMSAGLQIH